MGFLEEISAFFSNLPSWLTALLTAFIGAVVGGRYTLKGVNRAAKIAAIQAKNASYELQLSVLKGIKGEIFILFELYNKRMQAYIENLGPNDMIPFIFPIGDDNFTFYEQNAKEIAKLDDESRNSIISIYTHARSLIQSYKGNNQLVAEYEAILLAMAGRTNEDLYKRLHLEKIKTMIAYAQGLKSIDAEVRKAIKDGFEHIDKEVAKLERLHG